MKRSLKQMRRFFAAALFVGVCQNANGHADEEWAVSDSGIIEDLPSAFQPAVLRVDLSTFRMCAPSEPSIYVQFGQHAVWLPHCIVALAADPGPADIVVKGSWMPDDGPEVVSVELWHRRSKSGLVEDGYTLAFNMRTAELVEVQWWGVESSGVRGERTTLDLESICEWEEIEQLEPMHVAG